MVRLPTIALLLFALKFALDFLSPYRGVNFALLTLGAITVSALTARHAPLSRREIRWVIAYAACCVFWGVRGGQPELLPKFLSAIPLYIAVRNLVLGMSMRQLRSLVPRIQAWFFGFLLLNVAASFALASPTERQFFNFEHANLLGSYILLATIFVYISLLVGRATFAQKIFLSGAAVISTSTGAALLSLVQFVNTKKFSLFRIGWMMVASLVVGAAIFVILQRYLPAQHSKIFVPVNMLFSGELAAVVDLARSGAPIQLLGDETSSSLIWRMYAYVVFLDFAVSRPVVDLLFGGGFGSYVDAWGGIAVHNDYLLTLIDFGLFAFLLAAGVTTKAFSYAFKNDSRLIPLALIICVRLLLENNIHSYYVFSSLVMNTTFLVFLLKKTGSNE